MHYDVSLELRPSTQYLNSEVSLKYPVTNPGMDSLTFGLHRQLEVDTVFARNLSSFSWDTSKAYPSPHIPDGRVLTLHFDPPLEKGTEVSVRFRYHGRITEWDPRLADEITPQWVEMGNYLPWFPFNDTYGDFTYAMSIDCDSAYQVRSLGIPFRFGGIWKFEWKEPIDDIVLFAAPEMGQRTVGMRGVTAEVFHVGVSDSLAGFLADELLQTMSLYHSWFDGRQTTQMALVLSPRTNGAGYARRGLIVLAGVDDRYFYENRDRLLLYLFHETAHIWWWGAPTDSWEDWLNESFAEFSALLAVRKRLGNSVYQRMMVSKGQAADAAPPLWDAPREATEKVDERRVHAIYYDRGPVLLAQLENRLGSQGFLELCRSMLSEDVVTTRQFLDLLKRRDGSDVADWFEGELKGK